MFESSSVKRCQRTASATVEKNGKLFKQELTYFQVWFLAVVLLKDVAIDEYNTVTSSEVRLYTVPVSELVPQYKHWLFGFLSCSLPMNVANREGFLERPAEHVTTMQTVVETNILKLHIHLQLKSPVCVFQLRYVRVSLEYLQQKVVK